MASARTTWAHLPTRLKEQYVAPKQSQLTSVSLSLSLCIPLSPPHTPHHTANTHHTTHTHLCLLQCHWRSRRRPRQRRTSGSPWLARSRDTHRRCCSTPLSPSSSISVSPLRSFFFFFFLITATCQIATFTNWIQNMPRPNSNASTRSYLCLKGSQAPIHSQSFSRTNS